MLLIYVIDYCFQQTPDSKVWTDTAYARSFWEPYLSVYEEVVIVCRINQAKSAKAEWHQVNGPRIRVRPLTNYSSALGYFKARRQIAHQLTEALDEQGVVMLRAPSNLARCASVQLKKMRRPYGVDVVGDPWHAMAPGVVNIRGRAVFRWLFTRSQKQVCSAAAAVSYVASTLPELYPADQRSKILICSDVRLDRSWLLASPNIYQKPAHRLITVATLTQMYKGIDVLLQSIAICKDRGNRFTLTIIGTGKCRDFLEDYAVQLGVADQITFRGAVPWGPQLIDELDRADLFVLPSLVEVMPRALLEAMARALPAIATSVGAVSHVLAHEDIVEPGDAVGLAARLIEVTNAPERLSQMSRRNLAVAHQHEEKLLLPKWMAFHRDLCSVCYKRPEESSPHQHMLGSLIGDAIQESYAGKVGDASQQ